MIIEAKQLVVLKLGEPRTQQRSLAVESGKHPKEEIDHAKWFFLPILF